MADWQFKLEFKDFWHKDDLPLVTRSEIVVGRIKDLVIEIRQRSDNPRNIKDAFIASDLEDMADELERDVLPMFEELVETGSDDVENFDTALYYLYEWADTPLESNMKMCWVNTF